MAALWTPDPNDPVLWLSAKDGGTVEKSGDALISLADKSNQQKHATTHSAAARPTHGVQTLNGHPVIRFNGSSNVLRGDWAGQTFPVTIMMLQRVHTHSSFGRHFAAALGADNAVMLANGNNSGQRCFAAQDPGGRGDIRNAPHNEWGVTTCRVEEKADFAYLQRLNGAVQGKVTDTPLGQFTLPAGKYSVGARWDSAFAGIDFAELIALDNAIAFANLYAYEGCMAWGWGVQAGLDPGHVFASSPPYLVSNNATKATGGAVDRVVIRDYDTHQHVFTAIPAVNGDWRAGVPEGDFDITYFADGCAPLCHGPYSIGPD